MCRQAELTDDEPAGLLKMDMFTADQSAGSFYYTCKDCKNRTGGAPIFFPVAIGGNAANPAGPKKHIIPH